MIIVPDISNKIKRTRTTHTFFLFIYYFYWGQNSQAFYTRQQQPPSFTRLSEFSRRHHHAGVIHLQSSASPIQICTVQKQQIFTPIEKILSSVWDHHSIETKWAPMLVNILIKGSWSNLLRLSTHNARKSAHSVHRNLDCNSHASETNPYDFLRLFDYPRRY